MCEYLNECHCSTMQDVSINGIVLDNLLDMHFLNPLFTNSSYSFNFNTNAWFFFLGPNIMEGDCSLFWSIGHYQTVFFQTFSNGITSPSNSFENFPQSSRRWLLSARRSTNSLTKSRLMRKQHHLQKRRLENEPFQVVTPRSIMRTFCKGGGEERLSESLPTFSGR